MLAMSVVPVPPAPPSVEPRVDSSLRALQRQLVALLPEVAAHIIGPDVAPLELAAAVPDVPRLMEATIIEGGELRAMRVSGMPEPRFVAFLDGTQGSRVACYIDGLP